MVMEDHINLMSGNPLVGINDEPPWAAVSGHVRPA